MISRIIRLRRLKGILFLLGILFVGVHTASSQNNYFIYTVFINKIANYVEWPPEYKTGDFIIGVLGKTEATDQLKLLAMKKDIAGRKIKIAEFSSIGDITKCNMLFLPEHLSGQLPDVIKKLKGTSTMMITEKEGLALKGSCVNFVTVQGKPAFELNSHAMDEAGLKASKELTKYAIVL